MNQNQMDFFKDTSIYDALLTVDRIYKNITDAQQPWHDEAVSVCPEGCGTCCLDFEPDILEAEALYTATWLYFNQRAIFDSLLLYETVNPMRNDFDLHPNGCVFYNPQSTEHCQIYGGRMLICRLFGYCGDHDKNAKLRWRPCRFMPDNCMNGLTHRQYDSEELATKYAVLPPDMSLFTTEAMGIFPGNNQTMLLRDALPNAVKKINMILCFIDPPKPLPTAA
jgi:Fe-S-cluster containining protein